MIVLPRVRRAQNPSNERGTEPISWKALSLPAADASRPHGSSISQGFDPKAHSLPSACAWDQILGAVASVGLFGHVWSVRPTAYEYVLHQVGISGTAAKLQVRRMATAA